LTRLSSVAVSWRSTPLELPCSPPTLSNARTDRYCGISLNFDPSFVPGHHFNFLRAAPRRMMCCTTSVSRHQRCLLLTSLRRLLQVYLTLPLSRKQPHDLPPLRNAFVCQYAALATRVSTGDLRLEIACVAYVDPALHNAWAGYMVVPPCSTSRSQSYSQSFGKNARQRIAPGFGLLLHGLSHSGP
jgi:hypothetical protein